MLNDQTPSNPIQCPVCATLSIPQRFRHTASSTITYTLHGCPKCALQFWSPLKADPAVYENEGFEAYKDYHAGTRSFPRWAEPLFANLDQSGRSALDVGCGDGAVLARLSAAGYETSGIDQDEKSIRVAREKYGLSNVRSMNLQDYVRDCKERETRFDLITFFEVLEHQDDPLAFLSDIRDLCKSGGRIAGTVPNRDRFLARIDRQLSGGDFPPHHFLWFSAQALKGLLERSGFQQVSIMSTGAMPYQEVARKIKLALSRKLEASGRAASILGALVAPIAAVPVWLGMKLAPSHLFFHCRVPDKVTAQASPG